MRSLLYGIGVAAALVVTATAQAQLPDRPIRIVNSYAPGGAADIILRPVIANIGARGGPQVILEHKPGGGGVVGAMTAKQSAPDGTTVLLADLGAFAINPHVMNDLPYDPVRDFKPISILYAFPAVLSVPSTSPVKNLAELIALAKSTPGGLHYASQGPGSGGHLTSEMFAKAIGTKLTHVPYRGGTPASQAVATGEVGMVFGSYLTLKPHVENNAARPIAVTAKRRLAVLPDVPTLQELGFPQIDLDVWWGLVAPAGTPDSIIAALRELFVKEMAMPDIVSRLDSQGLYLLTNTPAEFGAIIRNDIARLGPAIAEAGVKN